MASYQISDNLLSALIKQESGGNPNAVSPKGAKGLTQIMGKTAANPGYGVTPLQDNSPQESIRFTRDYMGALLKQNGGDLNKALAAYNAGQGNVDKYGGVPPFKETQGYVKNIINSINPMSSAQAGEMPQGNQSTLPPGFELDKSPQQASGTTQPSLPDGFILDGATQAQPEQQSIGERALKSLPGDIKNIGQSTIDTVLHPIDTAEKLGSVARGAMQSALPEKAAQWLIDKGVTPDSRPDFKALADSYKKDFGSLDGFKEAIATHPATTLLNVTGALSGVQGIARKVAGKAVEGALQESTTAANKVNSLNSTKLASLEKAKAAGYVMPVSEVNGGFVNNRLEGIAGKAALGQQSVLKNQQVTNDLARKALKLPEDQPIDMQALEKLRREKGTVYADVAQLPNPPSLAQGYGLNSIARVSSSKVLEQLKQTRNDAQGWYDAYKRSASPDDLKKAKSAESTARSLDAELANRARSAGRNDLRQQLHDARTEIAKSYTVQKGLNDATGDINPVEIGKINRKGQGKVLTGELKTIGDATQAFKKYMKPGVEAQTPGVSKIEAVTAIGGGAIGDEIGGKLGAVIGAALPLISTPIRNMLLSKMYQKRFLTIAKQKPSKALTIINKSLNKNISKNALAGLLYKSNNSNKENK